MNKNRNFDLFIAKLYVNDGGWRFTICEAVSYVTNNNWILFYICWRNGTLGDKRGLTCEVCSQSCKVSTSQYRHAKQRRLIDKSHINES